MGGPNAEFALTLALALDGAAGIHALACDTDGVDGAAEAAGAMIGPDTLSRAQAVGLSPESALDDNDAHTFFGCLGDQVVTGPTLTNVNDFRAMLVRRA
jgi:hydroxypyruvate reductase